MLMLSINLQLYFEQFDKIKDEKYEEVHLLQREERASSMGI